MLSDEQFVELSLITNGYYLRNIREFCSLIQLSFLSYNQSYINKASELGRRCEEIGNVLINFANGNLSALSLESQIFVTEFTLPCEELTERLFGVKLATDITKKTLTLSSGKVSNPSKELVDTITKANQNALKVDNDFIELAETIYREQKYNKLFSYSYNAIIRYVLEEADLFKTVLERLLARLNVDPTYVAESEYWQTVSMLDSASFIRGLSDPENRDIIITANSFYNEFTFLLNEFRVTGLDPYNQLSFTNKCSNIVIRFKKFFKSVLQRLLSGKAQFIVSPTFIDNMYRNVNYFTYLLTLNKVVVKSQ